MNKPISFLVAAFTLFPLSGCVNTRKPVKYLIPANFVGWVKVKYKVARASALPLEEQSFVVRVPSSGVFETSDSPEDGVAKDEYYYVNGKQRQLLDSKSGWGGKMMIWGSTLGNRSDMKKSNGKTIWINYPLTLRFFVGTEQQFKKAGATPPVE